MSGYWLCDTQQGLFRIALMRFADTQRFIILYEDEPLGCCETPEAALNRLIHGETSQPSCGLDIRRLPLPTTLSDWVYATSA